jgi:hypothetical protein
MGSIVFAPTSTRRLSVLRNGVAIGNTAAYIPGETLTVVLSYGTAVGSKGMLTTTKGSFNVVCCTGNMRKPLVSDRALLYVPANATGNIVIVGIWSNGTSATQPLYRAPSFILSSSVITAKPSLKLV